MVRKSNYSSDRDTQENFNPNDKYSETGESEFSRDSTIPFDQDEVLSERHYSFGPMEIHGRKRFRARESKSEPSSSLIGKGPKGYKRSDVKIKEDVSEALYRNTAVDASEIEVFVNEGSVTLKGTVTTRDQKKMAEYAVEHLAGVIDVFNELLVLNKQVSSKPGPHGLMNNITGLN
jgi:BON domain